MSPRETVLEELASRLEPALGAPPVRIAIDGGDASGKTTLGDELAAVLRARGRPVVRAGSDAFHHPAVFRGRRGLDPLGYYEDAFDYPAMRERLLEPLGPGGARAFRTASHDLATDRALDLPVRTTTPDALLVFDGVFLQRPELARASSTGRPRLLGPSPEISITCRNPSWALTSN